MYTARVVSRLRGMFVRLFFVLFFVVLAGVIALSAGGTAEGSGPDADADAAIVNDTNPAVEIRLGVLPDVDSIPFVIGVREGFFRDEGVELVIEKFTSPVNRDTALQAGKLDAAVSDLLAVAFAINGGFSIQATSMTEGSYKLLLSETQPEHGTGKQRFETLKGKSIGISKNTIIEYCTDTFLDQAGLQATDIRKEAVPQIPLRLELFANGVLEAVTLPEPLASVAVANGAHVLGDSAEIGINPGVIAFRTVFLDANSDGVTAFYRGYNRTVQSLQETGMRLHVEYLITNFGFPEAAADTIHGLAYLPAIPPPEQEVSRVVSWLRDRSLIRESYEYSDLVDPRYLEMISSRTQR